MEILIERQVFHHVNTPARIDHGQIKPGQHERIAKVIANIIFGTFGDAGQLAQGQAFGRLIERAGLFDFDKNQTGGACEDQVNFTADAPPAGFQKRETPILIVACLRRQGPSDRRPFRPAVWRRMAVDRKGRNQRACAPDGIGEVLKER